MIIWNLTTEKAKQIASCLDVTRQTADIQGAKVAIDLYADLMQAVNASKELKEKPKRKISPATQPKRK